MNNARACLTACDATSSLRLAAVAHNCFSDQRPQLLRRLDIFGELAYRLIAGRGNHFADQMQLGILGKTFKGLKRLLRACWSGNCVV